MSFMHFCERSGGRLKNCWEKFFVCQLIVSLMILAPAALLEAHAQITIQNPSGAEVVSIVVDAKKRDGRPWDGPGALDYQSGESDRDGAIGLLKGLMKEAEKFVDRRVVAPDVSICILNLGPTSFGIAAGSTHCMNAADNLSRTRLTDSLAHEILRNDKVAVLLWDRDVAGCHDVIGVAILASRGEPAYSISARDEELVRRDVLQARSRCIVKEPLLSQFRVESLSADRCASGCRVGASRLRIAALQEPTRTGGDPEALVGAPFDGSWPSSSGCAGATVGSSSCSLPIAHWTEYGGNWSVDLPKQAGTVVNLYVSLQDSSDEIVTKIESVRNACARGRQGGKVVRVGVYVNSRKIGEIAYSHLNATVEAGGVVDHWGEKLGTLFTTTQTHELCWTGPHLHVEMSNERNYSCFNNELVPGQAFHEADFLGIIGGNRVTAQRQPCPS